MKELYCWAFHRRFHIRLTRDRKVCRKCDRIDPPHLRETREVFSNVFNRRPSLVGV